MTQEAIGGQTPTTRPRASVPARRKRSSSVMLLQLIIGILVVGAVVSGLYKLTIEQSDQGWAVPNQLGGYQLADVSRGAEAIAELRQLHGKDVGLSSGWIGYYRNNGVAWVGAVASEGQAFQLLDAMNKRIGAGNGPFTNLEQRQVEGQTVFTVVGQGQRHFYYQQGRLVIWLAAPRGGEDGFLKDALKSIRG